MTCDHDHPPLDCSCLCHSGWAVAADGDAFAPTIFDIIGGQVVIGAATDDDLAIAVHDDGVRTASVLLDVAGVEQVRDRLDEWLTTRKGS